MAQAQNQPFKFQEVFNLSTKGLDPANFKMGLMTFESQKYICVKEGQVSHHYSHGLYRNFGAANAPKCLRCFDKLLNWFLFVNSKSPSSTPPMVSTSNAAT